MKSKNFEFLRDKRAELATLGAFAERYSTTDPSSALVKLRTFVEQVVEDIYDARNLPKALRANLNDLLMASVFEDSVPDIVIQKMHALRIRGNRAAHGEAAAKDTVRSLLKEAFDVGRWFHVVFDAGNPDEIPAFSALEDTVQEVTKGSLKRQKKELLQKLARQEAQLSDVLKSLDEERKSREELERATEAELASLRTAGQTAATELEFSEAETRKFLIDALLVEAGWDVGANGADTQEVGQEIKVDGQPTKSGDGYADYVLWGDNGKPLAVVEAKKTSKSAEAGRTQAKLYADSLEKRHDQRPIIFYTNGVNTHLWDDAQNFPPRKLYGFYSKDSLEYLHFQRSQKKTLELVAPKPEIAGRMYQMEAIKRVTERFSEGHRNSLIVQATGTGKTRVSISICDVMLRANWAKRILFLCDRRELRKQADNTFKEFLPTEPRVFVTSKTASDREKRIYLATYPAMIKCFETFDVGFFDLIIADESHRSIYNKYRDIFRYFDACQVGLTATPIHLVDRNTYDLFGCEDRDPTASYTFEEAINHSPRYLTPFRVSKVTTKFLRDGIKYSQMTADEQRQLEAQREDAQLIEHESTDIDRKIFNKDTSRHILRNLMENGISDESGSLPGKTIVFARGHKHAEHLSEVFSELYPMYGGNFCRVIDNYDPRAEQLIDDFKNPDHELRIAISVDMMDTGLDVPEIVNLVFAKPIKSYVKFWQMIGRGTRLCPNLFGPGMHKTEFLIFDHWGNFEYFDEHFEEQSPAPTKSLMERVFRTRVEFARVALEKMNEVAFQGAIKLIRADINFLKNSKAIGVRDHWKNLQELGSEATLKSFAAATHAALVDIVSPLMRWCDIRGNEDAYRHDLLMTSMQTSLLQESGEYADLAGQLKDEVEALPKNLNQVKAKTDSILQVRSDEFWESASLADLEHLRTDLRSIMKHKIVIAAPRIDPVTIDVKDSFMVAESHTPKVDGQELIAYRQRVQEVLESHFVADPTLARIKAGEAVSEQDLDDLALKILRVDPQVDLKNLPIKIDVAGDLHRALRSIIGLDTEAVDVGFTEFIHKHTELTSQQLQFISILQAYICANGGLEVDRLYDPPFTSISSNGVDGVFEGKLIDELLTLIDRFNFPDVRGHSA